MIGQFVPDATACLGPFALLEVYTKSMDHSERVEEKHYDKTPVVDAVQPAVDLAAAAMSNLKRVWVPVLKDSGAVMFNLGLQFHCSETYGTWVKLYNLVEGSSQGFMLHKDGSIVWSQRCVQLEVADVRIQWADGLWSASKPCCSASALPWDNAAVALPVAGLFGAPHPSSVIPFLPGDIAVNPCGELVALAEWCGTGQDSSLLTAPVSDQYRGMRQPNDDVLHGKRCLHEQWRRDQLEYPADCVFTLNGWKLVRCISDAEFLAARIRFLCAVKV